MGSAKSSYNLIVYWILDKVLYLGALGLADLVVVE